MKHLLVFAAVLSLMAGTAVAEGPDVTYGEGVDPVILADRESTCQYGFQDYLQNQGSTLDANQQLGIFCPSPGAITEVGFFAEFIVIGGPMDIVVYDDGVEVLREQVNVTSPGVNVYDVADVAIVGDACIMLCPLGSTWLVTGEDTNSAPYGSTYWSNACECTTPFTSQNLTIWAETGEPTPVKSVTWGQIQAMFRDQ